MAQASRDQNRVTALLGVSSIDGMTPVPIHADPETNELFVTQGGSLPTEGSNPSLELGYTGDNLTTITKTIDGSSYVKTLTYSGSVLTDVSAWVAE